MHSLADDFTLVRRVGSKWTYSTESVLAVLQNGLPPLPSAPTLYPTFEAVNAAVETDATEYGAYLEDDLDLLPGVFALVQSGAISRTDPRHIDIRVWEYYQQRIKDREPQTL